jgi:hypothetical protein
MRALMIPTMIGKRIGISAGNSISRMAELVTMSIARPYSGRVVPSMIPGFSRNWRRTSVTTCPPTFPTACMASDAKRKGISPPMNRPAMTQASLRLNADGSPWSASPVVYESKRTSAASAAEPIA